MNNKTYTNPWAGLSSYQDPESADVQLKFCGRDNESFDVAQLIDDNIFVTLYGKSGTGKTSLLNAGVFPRLRQEQYLPVSIRLGMDAYNISFLQCILTKIAQAIQGKGTQSTIDVVPMPDDEQATEYLWSYFARTRFTATDGSTLFPVLVFDQFEEVFRNRRTEAETLLRQIHFMTDENHALSDRIVNGQPYQYDFNFRFVASIREDDLYRLEDSIDNCYLPELKRCRYRLRSLTEQGANDVILIPGEGLFKAEEQRDIVNKIISKSRNEDGSISTNIISLLCNRIFTYHSSLSTREAFISPSLVDSFLKGNPFEKFYNEATRGFSNREKSYIEEHLVDSTGRRNSVPESDFLLHVKNGAVLLDGERKILQRTSTSSDGGNYRVELIHDSFCEPLAAQKEKRQKRKRRIQMMVIASVALLSISIVAFVLYQMNRTNKANWKMMENQARAVANMAENLVDDGDAYTARMIALEVLPKDLKRPDCPYLPEVEAALRRACDCNMAAISLPIGHNAKSAAFSSDASKIAILYQSGDLLTIAGSGVGNHRIILADTNTGAIIQRLEQDTLKFAWEHYGEVAFCNGDRYIISGGWPVIRVWDVASGKLVYRIIEKKEIRDIGLWVWGSHDISVSPDSYYFAVRSGYNGIQHDLKIYEAKTGKPVKSYPWKTHEISFSPDGKSIIAMLENGEVKECSISNKEGNTILTKINKNVKLNMVLFGYNLASYEESLLKYEYDKDDLTLLDYDYNPTITIRDIRTGNILNTIMSHSKPLSSLSICKNGKTLVAASWDKTVKIWSISTGKLLRSIDMSTNPPYFTYCSSDGKIIAIASEGHFNMYLFNNNDDRTIWKKAEKVIFGKNTNNLFVSINDSIFLYNADSGLKKVIFHCPTVEIESEDSLQREAGITDLCGGIANFAISPNCQQIATSTYDGVLRIIDVATHKVIQQKRLGNLGKIRYSKDGKRLLSISRGKPPVNENDDTLKIWGTASWKLLHTINSNRISDASFLLDGNSIAYLTYNDIVIQNLQTGEKQVREKIFHNMGLSLSCSPDGNYFATCSYDDIIRVYDMKTLTQLYSITNKLHYYRDHDVQFSPDSKYIVAATEKGVDVWDAETGVRIHHIPVQMPTKKTISMNNDKKQFKFYNITDVVFSPDGRGILWSIKDSIVKITPFPPLQQLIDETRKRFKDRPLTKEERRKYYLE